MNSEFKQTLVLSKRKNLHTLWLQMTYIKMFHTVVCLCLLLYDTLLKKSINLVPVSHSKCNCCAGATCEYIANRLVVLLGPDSRLTPNSTIELRTGNGIVEQHSGQYRHHFIHTFALLSNFVLYDVHEIAFKILNMQNFDKILHFYGIFISPIP